MTLNPRRWRVGTKIGVVLVLFALVPVLVLAQLGSSHLQNQAESDARRELAGIATAVASGLDSELRANLELVAGIGLDRDIVQFAADPSARPALQPAVDAQLDTLEATHHSAGIFFVLDTSGVAIASSDRAILGKSYSFRPYFQRAMAGEANVSDVYLPIGTTSTVPGTAFATPILAADGSGTIVGVAVIKSNALTVSDALMTNDGRQAFIVEGTGIISSHPDDSLLFRSLRPLSVGDQQAAVAAKRFAGPVPTVETSKAIRAMVGATRDGFATGDLGGHGVAVAWQPLGNAHWTVGVSEPVATYSAAADQVRRDARLVAAVVAVLAVGLAVLAARRLSRPLRVLTTAATALEAGAEVDEPALAKVADRGDDLGALATRLADAARETRAREQRLEAQVAALRVEIDQERRQRDVDAIVESDAFADIKARAAHLRRQVHGDTR